MTLQVPVAPVNVRLKPLDVDYASFRRRVIFQSYKWDPQVGDVSTICDHACILSESTAAYLNRWAESLAAETLQLEEALQHRPELHKELGIRPKLREQLAKTIPSEKSVRVMRFDFHPTWDGWALSEVNSDVPGGYAEASTLPKLAAAHVPDARPGADVAEILVSAATRRLEPASHLVFVHATSYADDRQVMQFLADRFAAAGFRCALAAPDHLRWQNGRAISIADNSLGAVDGVVRFFPADWLPALPKSADWRGYFDSRIFACNPVRALLSQSKRLPLVWDQIGLALPAWRAMLPETRDAREVPWQRDEGWMLKPAFGRVGEGLAWRGGVSRKAWRRAHWHVRLEPRRWVAQRRFESRALPTREGARHLCVGVFTVDGKAAGFYGRLSATTVIDKHAQDIAILTGKEST